MNDNGTGRSTLRLPKRKGEGFLADYNLKSVVRQGIPARGLPQLQYARDNENRLVLISSWIEEKSIADDLLPFWLEELRSLRLLHTDRACQHLLAPFVDAGHDGNGFHHVVRCQDKRILADLLPQHIAALSEQGAPSERAKLWANIGKIARGVNALHARGITHRRLSDSSILTSNRGLQDFVLTGFEWSVRTPSSARANDDETKGATAVVADWNALAALTRSLFAADQLDAKERDVLKSLNAAKPDGQRIEKDIIRVANGLSNQSKPIPRRRLTRSTDYDGMLLAQVMQSVLAAAAEFPVEVLPRPHADIHTRINRHLVYVRYREHAKRESLFSITNQTRSLREQFHAVITERDQFQTDVWSLLSDSLVSEGESDAIELSFKSEHPGPGRTYIFEASGEVPCRPYLLVSNRGGRADQQFKRQLNAWRRLGDHRYQFSILMDPRSAIRNVRSPVRLDESYRKLDVAKQAALTAIIGSKPLFLVHGPPGVGKTRLVSELCRQVLSAEANSKLVLSAQSHAAVDNALRAIVKAGQGTQLIVRCRSRESKRPEGKFDSPVQARKIANDIADSPWYSDCSHTSRELIRAIGRRESKDSREVADRFHLRPIESLLLRAANVVLGTSNCSAFEYLLKENVQFDWSIVEEAAKATGGELIGALLLSQRQVMIGDHHQLPPFNADQVLSVLRTPDKVLELFATAMELGLRQFEVQEVQELFSTLKAEKAGSTEGSQLLCEAAAKYLLLFQTLITKEQESPGSKVSYTKMLNYQHRMHPEIARLVSFSFYDSALLSSEECKKEFKRPCPVTTRKLSWLPDKPLVWVDLPWVQKAFHSLEIEHRPGPYNSEEVLAVLDVVRQFELVAHTDEPTMALLTPYRKQVDLLKDAVRTSNVEFSSHLKRFKALADTYIHTVDSFQGNEADVVIVSLVRNNGHASLAGALGFLKDARRMNVLLSRAKWRLVIVGSLDFLRETVARHATTDEATSVAFLERALVAFDQACSDGVAAIAPYELRASREGRNA